MFQWLFGGPGELALGSCLAWRPGLIALRVSSDAITALSFFAIPVGILWFARRRDDLLREQRILAWMFGALILAFGATQLIAIVTIWHPVHGLHGLAKVATAFIATATVAVMWPQLPALVRLSSSKQLAEVNDRLRREVAAHEATLRELEAAQHELESRVAERTKELSLVKARFETALRGAQIYVFSQDCDLRHTWSYSPHGADASPPADTDAITALKRRVLASAMPEDVEVAYPMAKGRVLLALHVDPTFGPDRKVDGIMCAAIDVTRIRSLESEQRRLTEELGVALQRYETALRGSNVTVFTQDQELRYTSISNPLLGRKVEDIVGHTDDELIAADDRPPIVAMKREALTSGQAKDGEIRINDGATIHWFDLHVEPLRDVTGSTVGITCAAVDVTGRKEGEAHLRLLMRELTHRSKNLLAVIQAMARQTGRHSESVGAFLDHFGARLQALARSHDLLVQESWHGASLDELVRSQLGPHMSSARISIDGPPVLLRPEAAQSLGLALHELATNAAKYGALSGPTGQVAITWAVRPGPELGVELVWRESGGPGVSTPERRGFGSLVIERNLARSLDAEVDLTFSADGVLCRMTIPAAQLYSGH